MAAHIAYRATPYIVRRRRFGKGFEYWIEGPAEMHAHRVTVLLRRDDSGIYTRLADALQAAHQAGVDSAARPAPFKAKRSPSLAATLKKYEAE